MIFKKAIHYIFTNRIWLISAIAISFLVPYNTGYGSLGNACLTFVMFAVARKSKIALSLLFILFIAIILYMPAGHSYGRINIGYAASFLQTNTSEAIEFIKLNVIGIVLCCLAMLFLFIFVIASWGLNSSSKKIQYLFLIVFVLLNINSYPKRFAIAVYMRFSEAKAEVEILKQGISVKDQFTIIKKIFSIKIY
jgi:glucan phosphoethanolaminetransferase (alkaline phosphatase superfamily)